MTLLRIIYFSLREYSLEQTITRLQTDLHLLKNRVMNGDNQAALRAWDVLEDLEKKQIEFYYND